MKKSLFSCCLFTGKSKGKRSKASQQVYIPQDILCEILLRLPAKSIKRFETVHTSWLSLISSREFCLAHLHHQHDKYKYGVIEARNTLSDNPCLSLCIWSPISEDASGHGLIDIQNPFKKYDHYCYSDGDTNVEVFGSCNGLLLIALDITFYHFIVWNPSVRA